MEKWTFAAGLLLGGLAIGSVCWVWVQHRVLGMGGALLSLTGVILVGLPIWKTINLEWSQSGFSARLEVIEKGLASVADNAAALADATSATARSAQASQEAVKDLAAQVARLPNADTAALRGITGRVTRTEPVNVGGIEAVRDSLTNLSVETRSLRTR